MLNSHKSLFRSWTGPLPSIWPLLDSVLLPTHAFMHPYHKYGTALLVQTTLHKERTLKPLYVVNKCYLLLPAKRTGEG